MSVPQAKILIVEDDARAADELSEILVALGFQVSATASSAEAALAAVASTTPDLVLLDIGIEGTQDGIETAEILRTQHRLPVVFLTAYSDPHTLQRAKDAEPYAYLIKPVKVNDLRSTLTLALHRAEKDRSAREQATWLTAMLDSLTDAVVAVTSSDHITHMNRSAEALFGCTGREMKGRHLSELSGPQSSQAARPARLETLRTTMLDVHGRPLGALVVHKVLPEGMSALHLAESRAEASSAAPRLEPPISVPVTPDGPPPESRGPASMPNAKRNSTIPSRMPSNVPSSISPDKLNQLGPPQLASLVTGVAQEVNNPLAFVVVNQEYAIQELLRLEATLDANEQSPSSPPSSSRESSQEAAGNRAEETPSGSHRISDARSTLQNVRSALSDAQIGAARVRSAVAELSQFTPLESRPPSSAAHARSLFPAGDTEPPAPTTLRVPSPLQKRLLLVDDERPLLDAMARMLGPSHRVARLTSAEAALELLAQGAEFDLILSDVVMPGMDGLTFYGEVQRRFPDNAKRFAFMTGGVLSSDVRNFLTSGHCPLLLKPFSNDELREFIAHCFRDQQASASGAG